MNLAALPARDRILVTAHDLFYRDGIRATGVDRIIAESGVAKLTFYRHFPAKDDLVRAFLAYRHERWMAWFVDAMGRHGARPGGGHAPLVAAMAEWFADPVFRGCAFINVVAEAGDSISGIADMARDHKADMQAVIAELLPDGPKRDARARVAAVAVDGAIVQAQLAGADAGVTGLRTLLDALLQ
jgi:AcrR family transcriptional regulator